MEWFENWFDSPYYKILYQHRNDQEAQSFINRLTQIIPLNHEDWILDLACGRGRHAKCIHELGFSVIGIDLSKESILEAKKYENEHLQFFIQDMRNFSLPKNFQLILSLFTSFGYFEDTEDNFRVLQSVYKHLKPKGYFVLDFFNSEWVLNHLIEYEQKILENISFDIFKFIENQKIVKKIVINNEKTFYEKVSLFSSEDLELMLKKTGFEIIHWWGEYDLTEFDKKRSSRCMFCVKIH
jgi:SAM-dependent methyltransferase